MIEKSDSLKKNTILLMGGTVLNKGLQFIVIPFFSTWLSTSEYGQFDLLYTYVLLLIPIITLSTHEAVFRFGVNENNIERKKNIITGGLIVDVINFLLIFAVSIPFSNKLGVGVYISFLIYLIAELFSTYLRGYLRAIKRLDIYSIAMVISTMVMSVAVTVLVYVVKLGVIGMLVGYAIGTLTGNLVICILSKWRKMISFGQNSIKEIKRLISYSIPLVPNDLSWWIMNASDRQIINMYFGNVGNGIYAITHKIPALCSVIFNMFSISWQQEVVDRIEGAEHNRYFNEVFNKMLTMLLSFCGCLLAGSCVLYYYIFDLKYFEAIQYSPILISSAAIMALSQFLGGIQIALKKPKENGITTAVGAVSNIIIHLVLIKWIGLYAAAISTLVSNILIFILRVYLLRRYYRIALNRKTVIMIIIYVYFLIMAYVHMVWIVNLVNICLAGFLFIAVNRVFIKSVLVKQ